MIDSKLASLDNNNESGKSFIDIVTKMYREGLLSRHDVRDHVATFIVGGFDTTATAMAYTLHLLARHPEMQQALLEEVESVVTDDNDITKEQLKMLNLTEAVTKVWNSATSFYIRNRRFLARQDSILKTGLKIPDCSFWEYLRLPEGFSNVEENEFLILHESSSFLNMYNHPSGINAAVPTPSAHREKRQLASPGGETRNTRRNCWTC